MKIVTFLLAFTFALSAAAAVKPNENILLNGKFETDQTDVPLYWAAVNGGTYIKPLSSGGPNGLPFVRFEAPPDGNAQGEVTLRQFGHQLVSNGVYKISAWVRTKNFTSRNYGICVANTGWYQTRGINRFPETCDWQRFEQEFKLCGSKDGCYFALIYAIAFSGTLDVADFQLTAVSPDALASSTPFKSAMTTPRVVPWKPLLHRISRSDRKVSFRFFGKVPEGTAVADYDMEVRADDCGKVVRQPLVEKEETAFVLPDGAKGGTLTVAVRCRADGTVVWTNSYPYSLIDIPQASAAKHRRLNNLVTEVLAAPVAADAASQTFRFATVRDGWTFTALKTEAKPGLKGFLDDKLVIDAETPRLETFREIPAGEHTLRVEGAAAGGQVVVRAIAEIFNYCPGSNSFVAENKPYDWEFQKRFVLPAVTTQNGGNIPQEHRAWFRAQGYKWLANLGSTMLKDDRDLTRRLEHAAGLTQPQYDGVTCDEQFFGQVQGIERYTSGLRAYAKADERLIYTWIVGKPGTPGVDHDFLSACFNTSHGRGKLIFEAYCRTKPTEEEAKVYLNYYVKDTVTRFCRWYPDAIASCGVIFGNFNQIPILSLSHHPEVDYKYYLDMQVNFVANDPAFAGLGCIGYWGSYYADRELHEWSFKLMRHYCVEGNTSMLSEKYGLSYIPGLLQNGDFRQTLEPWTVTGGAKTDSYAGFGSKSQNRWGGNGGLGDTFVTLQKGSVSQHIKGLVPGRTYCLQYAAFDVKDVKANRIAPRRFPVECALSSGAEIIPAQSWEHIDTRVKGRYAHNNGVARINLRHLVFTAKAAEIDVTFRNDTDEELGVNCVSLNPYVGE